MYQRAAAGRGVEPAREVPAGDVGRIEELLAGGGVQPPPGGRVDRAPDHPQQRRVVDDRRGDHARAREKTGAGGSPRRPGGSCTPESCRGPAAGAQALLVDRGRDEVAPELADEVRGVERMVDAEAARRPVRSSCRSAEDRLRAGVVEVRVEDEVADHAFVHAAGPAGERACLLPDVVLGVGAAIGAEREQLHHLAARSSRWGSSCRSGSRSARSASRDRWSPPGTGRGSCRGRCPEEVVLVRASAAGCRRLSFEVANQSCQINVIRSISGWSERIMRSSHQR